MKKCYLLIIATILLAFCLFACGNNNTSNSSSSIESSSDISTDSSTSNTDTSSDSGTGSTSDNSSTENSTDDRTDLGDLHKVNNLKCEIRFKQTDEVIAFGQEKALEIYDIITSYDYVELTGFPSLNSTEDYIYIYFTGDAYSEALPIPDCGCYYIFADDMVRYNLSPYMSMIYDCQYEKGIYDQLCQYITENR